MKAQLFQGNIVVKKSPIAGYGVFARQDFKVGDLIEECYTLLTDTGVFPNYVFNADEKCAAVALGFGSLYNHAETPNAKYEYNALNKIISFAALKNIKAGEEILVSYGPTWFSGRELPIKFPFRYRMRRIFPTVVRRFLLITLFLSCLLALFGKS